jgi:cbb3-type cytochrome oxidase maturation protein
MWSMFLLIVLTLGFGFVGWLFFLWAVRSGQYDDVEGPKYRMLDDEEDAKKDDRGRKDNNDNTPQ